VVPLRFSTTGKFAVLQDDLRRQLAIHRVFDRQSVWTGSLHFTCFLPINMRVMSTICFSLLLLLLLASALHADGAKVSCRGWSLSVPLYAAYSSWMSSYTIWMLFSYNDVDKLFGPQNVDLWSLIVRFVLMDTNTDSILRKPYGSITFPRRRHQAVLWR